MKWVKCKHIWTKETVLLGFVWLLFSVLCNCCFGFCVTVVLGSCHVTGAFQFTGATRCRVFQLSANSTSTRRCLTGQCSQFLLPASVLYLCYLPHCFLLVSLLSPGLITFSWPHHVLLASSLSPGLIAFSWPHHFLLAHRFLLASSLSPGLITFSWPHCFLLVSSLSPDLIAFSWPHRFLLASSLSPGLIAFSWPHHFLLTSSLSPGLIAFSPLVIHLSFIHSLTH